MPALAGGSLPVLGSGKIEQVLNSKSQMLKLCNPFLAVYASTEKIVTSNHGFGVNYFFLVDIKMDFTDFPPDMLPYQLQKQLFFAARL